MNRYRMITENEKQAKRVLKNIIFFVQCEIGLTLRVGDVEVKKKDFLHFKKPVTLNSVDIDKIVISDKIKCND